jgi:biopolymer transport protein TolQ
MSVYLWTLVQIKYIYFKQIREQNKAFLEKLRERRGNILDIDFDEQPFPQSPLYRIFISAQENIKNIILAKNRVDADDIEAIEILIQRTISEEKLDMEESNYVLATMSSISTLLGLLGTVTGVMGSFKSMGTMGTASITAIAPGVAEALVTTVMGLLVAIPAAVLYNYVMNHIKRAMVQINNFSLEILDEIEALRLQNREYRG